jgi:hypothetical protein
MKRAFLLIVVPALLVALGFAQTPAASSNTDQTIKGCLGGSDGNYTVVEDGTGQTFKITTNSIDFKKHLGHEVTLIGHKASGASSAAADNSFAVTELNMISEHCAAAAAAPTATVTTPAETVVTPAATAAPPAEIVVTPPATAAPPAEIVVAPPATAAPPADIVVTPAADAAAPVATVSTPSETASTPAARHPRRSETAATATTAPDVTASSSSETASTPAAAAAAPATTTSAPLQTASTPDAAATTPAAPARHGALWLLISLAVLVIVIGTLVPFLGRWRKRKMLERTDAPNLSFNRETSSDQDKPEQPRKAA